jgi:hypothetical protein
LIGNVVKLARSAHLLLEQVVDSVQQALLQPLTLLQ